MREDRAESESVTFLLSPVLLGQSSAWDTSAPANNSLSELRDESFLTEPQAG